MKRERFTYYFLFYKTTNKEKIKRCLLDSQERKFLDLREREIKLKDSSKIQTKKGTLIATLN